MRLIDILPFLITLTFISLVVAGLIVARKYGELTAYVAFVWVTPLASIVWLKWGEEQLGFGYSFLNAHFLLVVVFVGFAVGIVCLPAILYLNWRRLSAAQIAGLGFCGLLHASPFLFYVLVWVSVLIWGK